MSTLGPAADLKFPDIDLVAALVHAAYVQANVERGITSRKSPTGEEYMVPYENLSEAAKDIDRNTIRAVYAAIRAASTGPLASRPGEKSISSGG